MAQTPEYRNNEALLLADLRQGNGNAFDYLFTSRYTELCRFAYSFTTSLEAAEDVVQEVFMRLWERGITINRQESLDSYLYVSVRNKCISLMRRRKPEPDAEFITDNAEEYGYDPDYLKRVWDVVNQLPPQCSVILKLAAIEEIKYAEIAQRLGISVNTVKSQMKKAYRLLREQLASTDNDVVLLLTLFPFLREHE